MLKYCLYRWNKLEREGLRGDCTDCLHFGLTGHSFSMYFKIQFNTLLILILGKVTSTSTKYLCFLCNNYPALVGVVEDASSLVYPLLVFAHLENILDLTADLFFLLGRKDRDVTFATCPVDDDFLRSDKRVRPYKLLRSFKKLFVRRCIESLSP
jgi:hypothetical protein